MPLYEYACRGCDQRFEVLQRLGADASGLRCPGCGGERLAREFSTFAAAVAGPGAAAGACAMPGPTAGCGCHPGRSSCP